MTSGQLKKPSAGADIEALCGKCGDTWHVVVAMVGNDVAKVQCKECGAVHKYRPLGGKATRKAGSSSRKSAGRSRSGKAAPAEPVGPTVEPDTSREVRAYRADEHFEVADRVQHPTFGLGVVETSEPGKITVWFPGGRKRLVQADPTPMLERPPPLEWD
jgi:predicted nucleic acid-binding Zn ribbon protein